MDTDSFAADSTAVLRSHMQTASISSYRALASQSGVSRWQIQQLRSGNLSKMRVITLQQIAKALNLSLPELLQSFLSSTAPYQAQTSTSQPVEVQLTALQTAALQTLETWLVQWPTVAQRAQNHPELSATKVLPFVRPVEQLMHEWQVEPIAAIDECLPYNPQYHQLVQGSANPGDLVRVTHTGQTHHGNLLHRAKVKPIQ